MPEITLSGYQPDIGPIEIVTDNTTVNVLAGAELGWADNSSFGINARDVSNTTFNVFGTLHGADWATLDAFDAIGARFNIGASGVVDAGTNGAMAIEGSYDAQVRNEGVITAQRGFGVEIIDPTGSTITNDGLISGVPGGIEFSAWYQDSSATFVNRGTLRSTNGLDGVAGQANGEAFWSSAAQTTVYNAGEIVALRDDASAIAVDDRDGLVDIVALITNSGTIRSLDLWGIDLSGMNGRSTITNSGSVTGGTGAMLGSAGMDLVTNRGTITGDVLLGSGNDVFQGTEGRHAGTLDGGAGDDRLEGGISRDLIRGGAGNDTLSGNGGTDRLDGGAGTDTILYLANLTTVHVDLTAGRVGFPGQTWSPETVTSIENAATGYGEDILTGSSAANRLDGRSGEDRLSGRAGNDTLIGGMEADVLTGGAGRDVFLFNALNESWRTDGDSLAGGDGGLAFDGAGAAGGDRISLAGIDASAARAGDQAFIFDGGRGAGHVWVEEIGSVSHVRANIAGGPAFEFDLAILDGSVRAEAYAMQDFIL